MDTNVIVFILGIGWLIWNVTSSYFGMRKRAQKEERLKELRKRQLRLFLQWFMYVRPLIKTQTFEFGADPVDLLEDWEWAVLEFDTGHKEFFNEWCESYFEVCECEPDIAKRNAGYVIKLANQLPEHLQNRAIGLLFE
jgi:hypothetical protein